MMPLLPTYGTIYPMPPGMWPFPYQILLKGVDATGKKILASNVPWDTLRPQGTDYYVSLTGSSGNNGLSPATPLDTIANVFAKTGPWRIHVMEAGEWPNSKCNLPLANRSFSYSIVCDAGEAVFLGCELGVTWAASSYPNVWFYANANVCQVLDKNNVDPNGYYTALTDVVDPTLITAGTEFIGTGLDGAGVYVRTFDSRNPNSTPNTLRANLSTAEYRQRNGTTGIIGYYKNIAWEGFQHVTHRVLSGASRLTVVMDTCRSYYTLNLSANPGGFEWLGTISFKRACRACKNLKDGDSFHLSGSPAWGYDEDCVYLDNGGDGLGNNNGHTNHQAGLNICLRITCQRNEGPNAAYVDAGTMALLIQCILQDSVRATNGNNLTSGASAAVYADQCTSSGSVTDVIVSSSGFIQYIPWPISQTYSVNGTASFSRKRLNLETLYV